MGDWIRRIKRGNRNAESNGRPYMDVHNNRDIILYVISRVNIAAIYLADGLNKYNSANIPAFAVVNPV